MERTALLYATLPLFPSFLSGRTPHYAMISFWDNLQVVEAAENMLVDNRFVEKELIRLRQGLIAADGANTSYLSPSEVLSLANIWRRLTH